MRLAFVSSAILHAGQQQFFRSFSDKIFQVSSVENSIDLIEEFAAEYLFSRHAPTSRALVAATVARFPQVPALHAAFALVSLAAHLEDPVTRLEPELSSIARDIYRCICALTADIYAVSHMTASQPTCADIAAFWSTSEDLFFHQAAVT